MKKICPLCQTVFENENIEHCPECYDKIMAMPNWMPKAEMDLQDYDEYMALQDRLNDPNSVEGKRLNKMKAQMQPQNNHYTESENIPKCPTCGSTNIRRITATERGVNAVMFGVFGTKRKCQFECQNPNCKYRW